MRERRECLSVSSGTARQPAWSVGVRRNTISLGVPGPVVLGYRAALIFPSGFLVLACGLSPSWPSLSMGRVVYFPS